MYKRVGHFLQAKNEPRPSVVGTRMMGRCDEGGCVLNERSEFITHTPCHTYPLSDMLACQGKGARRATDYVAVVFNNALYFLYVFYFSFAFTSLVAREGRSPDRYACPPPQPLPQLAKLLAAAARCGWGWGGVVVGGRGQLFAFHVHEQLAARA